MGKKPDGKNATVSEQAEAMKGKVKANLMEKLKLRMPVGPSSSFERITSLAPVTGEAHKQAPETQGPTRGLVHAITPPEGGTHRSIGAIKEEDKPAEESPDGVPETVKEETEDTQRDNT